MLAALSPVDYGVLLLYVAALVALGVYFSSRQKTSTEYLLAGRSLGWLPLGLSLAATLAGPLMVVLPAMAYEQGLACWLVPAALWLVLPVVVYLVVPIVRGLGLDTVHEYLEHRFDARVRIAAGLLFIAWRMLWLAAALVVPCQAISLAGGWDLPAWMLIVPLGILAALYTFLGGLRTIAWAGTAQVCLMLAGVAVVIGGVWWQLDGGPAQVAEVARRLGRMQAAHWTLSWTSRQSLFTLLPHWFFASLALCASDQLVVQRYLSAKHVNAARTAFLVATIGATLLLLGLLYAGLCLLAFYQTKPGELRPQWVVNIDGRTRLPIRELEGRELLDPGNPAHVPSWENIHELVAERRILQPNDKLPFTAADELIDSSTNRLLVEKLAMQRPNEGLLGGEWIVHRDAPRQMLPHFVSSQLTWGLAGLVLAALLAAALAALDAGLISLAAALVFDLPRRSRPPDQHSAESELQLARPLTLALGAATTLLAVLVSLAPELWGTLIALSAALAAPLLGLVLLGLLTRRATAAAALAAAVAGLAFSLSLGGQSQRLADQWTLASGALFTCGLGYLLSFVLGRRKSNTELRGLVAGCGTLGVRSAQEPALRIAAPAADDGIRWK